MHRIAGRQHHHRPAATAQDLVDGVRQRHRPAERARPRIVAGSMARCRSPPTTSSAPSMSDAAESGQAPASRPRPARRWRASGSWLLSHAGPSPISSALTAAAAIALPPRRPRKVTKGMPRPACDQHLLRFGGADEADGKSEDRRRPIAVEIDPLDQTEERRRRIADDHNRAVEPLAPQIDAPPSCGYCRCAGLPDRLGILGPGDDLVGGGKMATNDAGRGHRRIAEQRRAAGECRPAAPGRCPG